MGSKAIHRILNNELRGGGLLQDHIVFGSCYAISGTM
jgi:hypothetical protein